MKKSVQYDIATGDIRAVVTTSRPPEDKDFPEGVAQLLMEQDADTDGMRVENGGLVPCARIAKERHNAAILSKISRIEAGQERAIRELNLTGNKESLQKIEDDISALRKELQK